MTGKGELGAPGHVCKGLKDVAAVNEESDIAYAKKLQSRVDEGTITAGDAEGAKDGMNADEVNEELFGYCRNNCTLKAGGCALEGYGKKLMGADYSSLSPADKELYDFYHSITVSRMTSEMAAGVFLG